MFRFVEILTNIAAFLLSPFVSKHTLETWKPVHLCWWFDKNNKPRPKYFIGGGASPPNVTTDDVSANGSSSIYAEGTTDEATPNSAYGFVYIQGAGTPTLSDNVVTLGGSFVGTFSTTITGLDASTLYSVSAYATNNKGTGYGSTLTATTFPPSELTRDLSDNLTFSDQISMERGIERTLEDSLTFSDQISTERGIERTLEDSLAFSDEITSKDLGFSRDLSDSLTLLDEITIDISFAISRFRVIELESDISSKSLDATLVPIAKDAIIETEELISNINIIRKDATLVPKAVDAYVEVINLECDISKKMSEAYIGPDNLEI